jgi:hypothetical protein
VVVIGFLLVLMGSRILGGVAYAVYLDWRRRVRVVKVDNVRFGGRSK